jgi:hypothetical protein
MKITHPNNTTTEAIGFIDLGVMIVPRAGKGAARHCML